jgi:rod shape-determining protein MreC
MRNFFKSVKFKIVMSVLAVLLLGVFVAAVSSGGTSPLTNALNFALSPLNEAAAHLKEDVSGFFAGFRSSSRYLEEIGSLQAELEDYREQLADYEKLQQKLNSYEDFLEVKNEHPDYTFLPATVIMRDGMDIYETFTINKGTADGVDVNMPVLSGENLIGVVREVTLNSALVFTVFHPDVSVSAYEIRTREDCYTKAESAVSAEGLIKIMGLTRTTPVVSGGIVCTSGIGGVYPRDLIIGTVTQVVGSESDISAYALVKPALDFGRLIDVFVLTSFEEKAQ